MTLLLKESRKRFGVLHLYIFFGQYGKKLKIFRECGVLYCKDETFVLCDLFSWSYLFMENATMSLIYFIVWLGLAIVLRRGCFCFSYPF